MKIIVFIVAVFITQYSFGQGQKYVFAEGGGVSGIAAANFDMRFKANDREGFGFRAGFGHTLGLDQNINFALLPLGVNYVYGKDRSAFVVGINSSVPLISQSRLRDQDAKANVIIIPEVSYRFRPKNRGVAFHASYTPLLNSAEGPEWLFIGLGIGYSWK